MRLRKIARAIAVTMAVIVGAGIGPVMIPSGAVLAAVPAGAELNIDSTSVLSEGTVENASGEGWTYDSETNTLALTDYSGESITGSSLGDLTIAVEGECEVSGGMNLAGDYANSITIRGENSGALYLSKNNASTLNIRNTNLIIGTESGGYLWLESAAFSSNDSEIYAINTEGTITINGGQNGGQIYADLFGSNYDSPAVGTGGGIFAGGGITVNSANVWATLDKNSGVAHAVAVGSGMTIAVNGDSRFEAECFGDSTETRALGITGAEKLTVQEGPLTIVEKDWMTENSDSTEDVVGAQHIHISYPAPNIVTSPRSATYYYGATASPIRIVAENQPEVEAVGAILKYNWYKGRTKSCNERIEGSYENHIVPSTTTIGRTYYEVLVRSGRNGKTKSIIVTVDVKVPTPPKTGITKIYKSGSKNLILKWKKISNATGYKIYMATKKKGTYKLVKTVNKNSVTSYKKTKLKKGKTYYFKIKTYRTIQNVTETSGYSKMKYKKR